MTLDKQCAPCPELEIRFLRSKSEIETLRPFWESQVYDPNADLDHFLLVCEFRPEIVAPMVLAVYLNGEVSGLLVGRLERIRLQPRIGYWRLPGIPATCLSIISGGEIGSLDDRSVQQSLSSMVGCLAEEKIDVIWFHHLHEQSNILPRILHRISGTGRIKWSTHREMRVESRAGFLLEGMKSKHRSWIKRKERDLEQKYPNSVTWSWITKFEDIDPLCNKFESIASTTYQRGLNAGFHNDPEYRSRLALFAHKGQFRAMLLEVGGSPSAFWIGVVSKGVFHSFSTGYIPSLREFEVGTLLFLRLSDELAREGVERVDFGLGDAQYKERFGTSLWKEASVKIYSRSFHGRLSSIIVESAECIDLFARNCATRFGATDRIKQSWRSLLRSPRK